MSMVRSKHLKLSDKRKSRKLVTKRNRATRSLRRDPIEIENTENVDSNEMFTLNSIVPPGTNDHGEETIPISDTNVVLPLEIEIQNTKKKVPYSRLKKRKTVNIGLMKWRTVKKRRTVDCSEILNSTYNSDRNAISQIDAQTCLIDNFHQPMPSCSHDIPPNNMTEIPQNNMKEISQNNITEIYKDDITCSLPDLVFEKEYESWDSEIMNISGTYLVDGKHFLKEILGLQLHRFYCKSSSDGFFKLISSCSKMLQWVLKFQCPKCLEIKIIRNEPHTSSPSIETSEITISKPLKKSLSLAEKAVWGFTCIGGGHYNMEEVFSTLGVQTICDKTFQKVEERLGKVWKELIYDEMIEAGKEEKKLAVENGEVTPNGMPFITVVVDGGWSHRSYGHRYSSNSGVACVIGQRTKKILDFGVRNKYCSTCIYRQRNNLDSFHPNCAKNWDGPSSSMETDILIEIFNNSKTIHGLEYHKMIGDGDSSAYAKIRENVSYGRNVEKIECVNHVIKNYTKRLFKIQSHSKANNKILTNSQIKRLKSAARGAIIENSKYNNIKELKEDLENGPFHVFGDHTRCKIYYCLHPGEKTSIPDERTPLFNSVRNAVKPIISKTNNLIKNYTSNLAENYMSLVAKFSGGKQINRGKRTSFNTRTRAAALDFQLGPQWHYKSMKKITGQSPTVTVKKTAMRRENKIISCKKALVGKRKIKATHNNFKKGEEDYGPFCQQIDMDPAELNEESNELLKKLQVSSTEAAQIEVMTRGQADNPLWIKERKERLTASNFGLVAKRRETSKWAPVIKKLLYNDITTNAMTYGRNHEFVAIDAFEKKTGHVVIPSGLFIDLEYGFLGASPDGLVGDNAIVEVKCPKSAENLSISEAMVLPNFCLDKKTNKLKINHNYMYQIQGQLRITGRSVCFFVIWTKKEVYVEEIKEDKEFWKKMEPKLIRFYKEKLIKEIVDPRVWRHLPIRE